VSNPELKDSNMFKLYTYIITLVILIIIQSCNYFEVKRIRETSIGSYKLDLSKSRIQLSENDSVFFKNLTFTLTADSFEFSKMIPYNFDSVGTWDTETVDAAIYIDLIFRTKGWWQIGPGDNYIDMPYWFTIEQYPQKTGMLHFVKYKL
jgi:hypothetical protein